MACLAAVLFVMSDRRTRTQDVASEEPFAKLLESGGRLMSLRYVRQSVKQFDAEVLQWPEVQPDCLGLCCFIPQRRN